MTDTSAERWLQRATTALGGGTEAPRREAELLLRAATGLTRAALLAGSAPTLDAPLLARLDAWIERRRRGEPLAYITGRRGFWTLELEVTDAVLVPRPETELLVERALAGGRAAARVLDLGTGSGAIALALASERPRWSITGVDRSGAALDVARRNAARLGLGRVRWLEGSWFAPVAGERFDLIVSNPPYIAADDPALDDPALRHEPRMALTPGGDGLAALREIATAAPARLAPGGALLLEHGAAQGPAVRALLEAQGFRHVVSHRDLAGHERVTEGRSATDPAAEPTA